MRLELIFSIHRATHRIGLYIQQHAPDLTQAEAHILCHLHESGDSTVSSLHRAFAHKRSTLTSVLDRLDARGLVTRESSQKDRRSFVIKLTGSGKKKAASIHRQLESLEAQVLRANDRRAVQLFGQVIHNLEEKAAEE
ncbi:MAG: MarR family transcriptional regulator [Bryobacteraceae bacterium]|jgi:DNA-binding MarR family transcriptional regulator